MSDAAPLDVHLASEAALDAFVAAWASGALPKAAWTHAAHVAVCAYHGWPAMPVDELWRTMRRGIRAYNEAVGTANTATSGYHETLTRLWAGVIAGYLREHAPPTRLEAVRSAVATFGTDRSLHARFYTFDVVADTRARAEWVPPDRPSADDPGGASERDGNR